MPNIILYRKGFYNMKSKFFALLALVMVFAVICTMGVAVFADDTATADDTTTSEDAVDDTATSEDATDDTSSETTGETSDNSSTSTETKTEEEEKEPIHFPDLPYRWSLNVTLSAGSQSADLTDGRNFLINTFHIGAETNRGLYRKDIDYKNSDKVRAGVSINNELQFGRVTAMVDWGVYLYNPVRNFYDHNHPVYGYGKRPLFYKMHSAGSDEAWHYIRFGVKCRVWDNIYVQALAKTHMHIAELIEFGVGYNIPFVSKSKRRDSKDVIFHNREGWWKNY